MVRKPFLNEELSPIDEFFMQSGEDRSQIMDKLFDADEKNIKQKTELNDKEILIFAKMKFIDDYLESIGLNKIFSDFNNEIMSLKVSKDRQSRREFVEANKSNYEQEKPSGLSDTLLKKLNIR